MQIDYTPGWQEEKHLTQAATQSGRSVEQYVARLLDEAVLAEMLQAGLDSPASDLTKADLDRLRERVRESADKRQAS